MADPEIDQIQRMTQQVLAVAEPIAREMTTEETVYGLMAAAGILIAHKTGRDFDQSYLMLSELARGMATAPCIH